MADEAKTTDGTPEEKLLKVIQDGTGNESPGASEGDAAASAKGDETAAPAARKPSLRFRKPRAAPAAASAQDAGVAAGASVRAASRAVFGGGAASGVAKKRPRRQFTIRSATRALGVAALLVTGLSTYEIGANVQRVQPEANEIGPVPAGPTRAAREPILPDLEVVVSRFIERPILRYPEKNKEPRVPPVGPEVNPLQPWKVFVQANLRLKGLSSRKDGETEAIIEDQSVKKMLFLARGAKFLAGDREIEVKEIAGDQVVLAYGDDRIALK